MKLDKLRVFAGLNLAVLIAAAIVGVVVSSEAQKYANKDVFYIAPVMNGPQYFFSPEDIKELEAAYQPLTISYISLDSGLISYDSLEVYSKIIYTSDISDSSVIINDSLAWQLFGSLDVVDKNLYISGELHTIVGISKQQRVTKDGCCAYLSLDLAPGEREISGVYFQPVSYNKLGYLTINTWLEAIGKDARDYYVADMNLYLENIAVKYQLLLLFIALYVAVALVNNSYKLLKHHYERRKNIAKFVALLCAIIAADVIFIVILLNGLSFDMWVPHSTGSRLAALLQTISNSRVLPAKAYLLENLQQIVRLNAYANAALISGGLALLNFIFVHFSKGESTHGQHNPKQCK